MKIEIKTSKISSIPAYQTEGSAAMDLYCIEDVTIFPGETKLISTGISIHIQDANVAGLIIPRSGLGTKGLVLANTIGLIDSDYQGELKIAAWNRLGEWEFDNLECVYAMEKGIELKAGDRIAQLMFVPIIKAQWSFVEEFSNETERGIGGFGSTG